MSSHEREGKARRNPGRISRFALFVVAVAMVGAGCSRGGGPSEPVANQASGPELSEEATPLASVRLPSSQLPNLVQVHPLVFSGGLPLGEQAFAELAERGVKTIVSVDGAKPDVALARRFGLRYVHLPHGYDGVPQDRARTLAKAVHDLEGPLYIHCHHGKHRSPAAASVACVMAGLIPADSALAVLELAGTSPRYRGLHESARAARKLPDDVLDALQVVFPETADVPAMAEAMVALERTHDHLEHIASAGWKTPPDHPDLDPAHEALLLREHFTELLRAEEVQNEEDDFRQLLEDSETAAGELERALRACNLENAPSHPPVVLDQQLGRVSDRCHRCHERFRDQPRGAR